MNANLVRRVSLTPQDIDCVVFWTKDPSPLLARIDEISNIPYYVQFTLNAYTAFIEPNLPPHSERVETFIRLADKIGPDRIVWRYSPILRAGGCEIGLHEKMFANLAKKLEGYTKNCRISFLDLYKKNAGKPGSIFVSQYSEKEKYALARKLYAIADGCGISLGACGDIDTAKAKIIGGGCVDAALASKISGRDIKYKKDPGQPKRCLCTLSADIGAYDTCSHGCIYCYATGSKDAVKKKLALLDEDSPMLCGSLRGTEKITPTPANASGNKEPAL